MDRATVLREVRIMRFEEIYGRFQRARLSCEAAADLLGVSVSAFGRWRQRYELEGASGLYDRRLARACFDPFAPSLTPSPLARQAALIRGHLTGRLAA